MPPGLNPGKAVHLMDIHAEKGMQCADCHFAQDSHGNGLIYGEVANAVEIGCKDCHGTVDAYPTLRTSGPAARPQGNDLEILRNPDGQRRFEWIGKPLGPRTLIQRSVVDPKLSWEVHLVKDSVDPANAHFNEMQRGPSNVPLLLGAGEKSPFAPLLPKMVASLREMGFAKVESTVIPGAVHYLFEDQPESMAQLIETHA